MAIAERTLESARWRRGTPSSPAKTHRTIAALLARDSGARRDGARPRRAVPGARRRGPPAARRGVCSWLEAELLRETDPDRGPAPRSAGRSTPTARANSPLTAGVQRRPAHAIQLGDQDARRWRFATRWRRSTRIETLRSLQDDAESSAELFSDVDARLLLVLGTPAPRHAGRRSRAGVLDHRAAARALPARSAGALAHTPRPVPSPRREPPLAARGDREGSARRSWIRRLGDDDRRTTLQQLEELERQEQEARRQIAVAVPRQASREPGLRQPRRRPVGAGRQRSAPVVSGRASGRPYEGEFGGGSWLIAVTRARPLGAPHSRSRAAGADVPVFTGLLEKRRRTERRPRSGSTRDARRTR